MILNMDKRLIRG
jgi:hypothetical protein